LIQILEIIKNKELAQLIYSFLFGFNSEEDYEGTNNKIPVINQINRTGKCKFIDPDNMRFSYSPGFSDEKVFRKMKKIKSFEIISPSRTINSDTIKTHKISPSLSSKLPNSHRKNVSDLNMTQETIQTRITHDDAISEFGLNIETELDENIIFSEDEEAIPFSKNLQYERTLHNYKLITKYLFNRLNCPTEYFSTICLKLFEVLLSHHIKDMIKALITDYLRVANRSNVILLKNNNFRNSGVTLGLMRINSFHYSQTTPNQ
jgi:hypothetical protein